MVIKVTTWESAKFDLCCPQTHESILAKICIIAVILQNFYPYRFTHQLVYLAIFCILGVLEIVHTQVAPDDLYTKCLKRCSSVQGCSFLGPQNQKLIFRYLLHENHNFWVRFQCDLVRAHISVWS